MKKKIRKFAAGGSSIDEGVRARALASVANLDKNDDSPAGKSGYGEENAMPEATKKAAKKPASKLPMPDYSNEDLDRMGMNEDLKPAKKADMNDMPDKLRAPNYKAPSVVKTVSKEVTKPTPRSPGRMLREESEFTIKPRLQEKGERLMKNAGLDFKSGGAVRKSASSRADGCAIRGKTRA